MRIITESGIEAYMNKHRGDCLIIDMRLNVTNPGCGCGETRNFYVPEVRLGFPGDGERKGYFEAAAGDIRVLVSSRVPEESEKEITIYLENLLITKKLAVKGIDMIVG